jgi:hypothetical protein
MRIEFGVGAEPAMKRTGESDQLAELVTACEVLGWYGQEDPIWGHAAVRDAENRGV